MPERGTHGQESQTLGEAAGRAVPHSRCNVPLVWEGADLTLPAGRVRTCTRACGAAEATANAAASAATAEVAAAVLAAEGVEGVDEEGDAGKVEAATS